ncbi:DUF6414 family protein [Nocardia africana]|uniref:DUF6414 family protein n=1 Tax=Nocardia africana TaxID=134964 RepID=UPI0007A39707|nr:hypothetical protein [Nocardia africana]MCC3316494.1 hypothetical protein [Nocardia africana]
MLRRFVYLDVTALDQYIAALEGGLASEIQTRSKLSGGGEAGVDAKVLKATGRRARESEESRKYTDAPEARFDRLVAAADDDPEELGWFEVGEPEQDFKEAGIGAMISWECEIFIPDYVRMIARSGEMQAALQMMQTAMPMAEQLGFDTDGMPSAEQITAMSGFLNSVNASLLVVGEDIDTDWRVCGTLTDEFIRRGEIDGPARIVGKISKKLRPDEWKPYLTFPGMNILPRDERRKLARTRPDANNENQFLQGPALVLELLAIYR